MRRILVNYAVIMRRVLVSYKANYYFPRYLEVSGGNVPQIYFCSAEQFPLTDAETFPCFSETFGFLANGDELGELFEPLRAGRFKKWSMPNNYQAITV